MSKTEPIGFGFGGQFHRCRFAFRNLVREVTWREWRPRKDFRNNQSGLFAEYCGEAGGVNSRLLKGMFNTQRTR